MILQKRKKEEGDNKQKPQGSRADLRAQRKAEEELSKRKHVKEKKSPWGGKAEKAKTFEPYPEKKRGEAAEEKRRRIGGSAGNGEKVMQKETEPGRKEKEGNSQRFVPLIPTK